MQVLVTVAGGSDIEGTESRQQYPQGFALVHLVGHASLRQPAVEAASRNRIGNPVVGRHFRKQRKIAASDIGFEPGDRDRSRGRRSKLDGRGRCGTAGQQSGYEEGEHRRSEHGGGQGGSAETIAPPTAQRCQHDQDAKALLASSNDTSSARASRLCTGNTSTSPGRAHSSSATAASTSTRMVCTLASATPWRSNSSRSTAGTAPLSLPRM